MAKRKSIKTVPVVQDVSEEVFGGVMLESGEDLEKLNGIFGVDDSSDISDIMSGSVGLDDW